MSTSFKCPLCKHYLSSQQGYSRHLNKCLKKVDAEEPISDIISDINDIYLMMIVFEKFKNWNIPLMFNSIQFQMNLIWLEMMKMKNLNNFCLINYKIIHLTSKNLMKNPKKNLKNLKNHLKNLKNHLKNLKNHLKRSLKKSLTKKNLKQKKNPKRNSNISLTKLMQI